MESYSWGGNTRCPADEWNYFVTILRCIRQIYKPYDSPGWVNISITRTDDNTVYWSCKIHKTPLTSSGKGSVPNKRSQKSSVE